MLVPGAPRGRRSVLALGTVGVTKGAQASLGLHSPAVAPGGGRWAPSSTPSLKWEVPHPDKAAPHQALLKGAALNTPGQNLPPRHPAASSGAS